MQFFTSKIKCSISNPLLAFNPVFLAYWQRKFSLAGVSQIILWGVTSLWKAGLFLEKSKYLNKKLQRQIQDWGACRRVANWGANRRAFRIPGSTFDGIFKGNDVPTA